MSNNSTDLSKIKNIINNFELNLVLKHFAMSYPEYQRYIQSNLRKHLVKTAPCLRIPEHQAHFIYLDYFKIPFNESKVKNPEVVLSKKNGYLFFDQLIINESELNKIQSFLDFLRINQIEPKPKNNIQHLIKKSEIWHSTLSSLKEIEEGEIEEITIIGNKRRWVKLIDYQSFHRESILMKNCVKNYFLKHSQGKCSIYSLRDEKNKPLITAEVRGSYLVQIRGVANKTPEFFSKEISFFLESNSLSKAPLCVENDIPVYNTMVGLHAYEEIEENFGFFEKIGQGLIKMIYSFLS